MAFIRVKTRTNKSGNKYSYAYLVQNKHRKKGTKQTIKHYLGRIYHHKKETNQTLKDFLNIKHIKDYFNKNNTKKIILDIIKLELSKHNFKNIKQNTWNKEESFIDLNNFNVYDQNKRSICLAFNDGVLTNYTLKKLHNSKHKKDSEIETGKDLANNLISTGISIEKEIFVRLVQKIQNQ